MEKARLHADGQAAIWTHRIERAVDTYRASKADRAEERQLVQVAERTDDVLLLFDGTWDELLFVNSAYQRVWDRPVGELRDDPTAFLQYVHPDDREAVEAAMDRLASGETAETEYRVTTAAGTTRRVHARGQPILRADGEVNRIVVSVRDITERRQRTRERKQERDRFSAVFEKAFDAMVIADDDGEYIAVNESATELFGVDREDLLGRSIADFAPPEFDFQANWEGFQDSADDRGLFPLVRPDGDRRIVEYAATTDIVPGQHLSVLRDVTEREEREAELEQREQRYRNLVEESPAPINLFDSEGATVWGNDAVLELLGLDSRDELVGRSIFDFIRPTGHETAKEELKRVVEDGESAGPTHFRLRRADGETRHVRVTTTPGWYEGDRVGQAVVIDITDRHRYEEMLNTLHDRMRAMTRADSRSESIDTAVETMETLLDLDGAVFYDFDGENRLVPIARSQGMEPDLDERGGDEAGDGPLWDTFVAGEPRLLSECESTDCSGPLPFQTGILLPVDNHGLLFGGRTSETDLTTPQQKVANLVMENLDAVLDRVEKEATISSQGLEARRQTQVLDQLRRFNGLIRGTVRDLISASSRAEIRSSTCEQAAAVDGYAFAWIGVRDPVDDSVVPKTWSGTDPELVEQLGSPARHPQLHSVLETAYQDGTVQVVSDVLSDGTWSAQREPALSYDYRSIAVVPISYRDHVEDVLVLHARSAGTFDESEQSVLAELGDIVGYALRNVQRVAALQNDNRTEVVTAIGTDRLFTNRLRAILAPAVDIVDVSPNDSTTVSVLLECDAADANCAQQLAESELVESVEQRLNTGSATRYQVTISTPPLVRILRENDAQLLEIETANQMTEITVLLPGLYDVRSFVEEIQAVYPDTTLVARRDNPEPVGTWNTFSERVLSDLTDRQLEALNAAQSRGFYQWPRESTSAELAEHQGIASSTFQYHLRAAERKIMSALLDTDDDETF